MSRSYRERLARAKVGDVAVVTLPWDRPLKSNPNRKVKTVTKVISANREALEAWCRAHGVPVAWIHASRRGMWHVDLWGGMEARILVAMAKGENKEPPRY